MARLPQPGGDDGAWGAILNDFLEVEHNADGSLKLRTDGTFQGPKYPNNSDIASVVPRPSTFDVRDYGAKGDGTTDDSAAIQAAINAAAAANGGTVLLPPAVYNIATTLVPASRVRICGTAWGRATLLSTTTDLFATGNAYVTLVEIDHLRLDVTNGHVFAGAYLDTSSFHHLQIFVRSAGKSVWSAPNITLMIQCYFSAIQVNVYGATRSVPAWNLVSSGVDKLTECAWDKIVEWNQDGDSAQYQFYCVNNGTSSANRNLSFRDIVFERPCGGSIYIESSTGTLIDNCHTWDTPTNSIVAASFYIGKNAGNSIASANTVIRNSGRDGDGLNTGTSDIKLDANCTQTLVEACSASGTGIGLTVDLGGSDGVMLLNMPASFTTRNAGAATYTRTSRGSIYAQPNNGSNAFTGSNSDSAGNDTTYKGLHPNANSSFISASVTNDTVDRFRALAGGQLSWGSGSATRDTNLYRASAGTLQTDGSLVVSGSLTVSGATVSAPPVVLPTDMNYAAWAYDPIGCRAGQTPTAGILYLSRVQIRSAMTLSNIFVGITTAGSGLTSGQNFVGLYNSSGTLVGSSADQTTNWATGSAEKQIALSSSVSATAGFYWVGILANGTTTPTFAVGSQLISNLGGGAASASTRRFGQYSSSLTSLPANITPTSITQITNQTYWAAVN